jgi:hypothetical protein
VERKLAMIQILEKSRTFSTYVVTHAYIVEGNLPIFDLIVLACYPGDATWRLSHGSLTRMSNVEKLRTEHESVSSL